MDYKSLFIRMNKSVTSTETLFDILSLLLEISESGDMSNKEIREVALSESLFAKQYAKYLAGRGDYDAEDIYWQLMKFEAPYLFDSYMIYLEKNRVYRNRFYEPKRKQFLKLGLIQAMQDLEDDKLDLLSLSLPPGTGKTTLEKFFTSWVMGRHPEAYSLFFSHSGDITRMFYDGVLDIISNEVEYTWREIFPFAGEINTNAKTEQINLGKYKPFSTLQCSSVGSKNAGKVRAGSSEGLGAYLFCDDLIGGIEEALSKTRLDKLWSTYSVDARQRKLNDSVKEIHIATRWSVHDVIGRLQRTYKDNDRCRFIAVPDIDPETGESNFEYEFNGMTADFFRDQALLMDEISYRCLYKNEPIEREGLLYNDDDLRRYLTLPAEEPDAVLGICDTKDKGTDFMFAPCLLAYGEDYYLVDCVCDQNADYGVQYQSVADLIVRNRMNKMRFEHNNGGGRVGYEVSKIVDEMGYHDCNITSKQTTGNKETKIIVQADWVKKHIIFKDKSMYTERSQYGVMMSNLVTYSIAGRNEHDDVQDGLAMFADFVKTSIVRPTYIVSSPF